MATSCMAYGDLVGTVFTPFLAGLAGSSDLENAEIFSVVDVVEDLWTRIFSFFWEKDEVKKV